jgi:hypothetical protein
MTGALVAVVVVLVVCVVTLAWLNLRGRAPSRAPAGDARRILFPFVANALSQGALDAALRLARAEDATLVPVFLARVSMQLPLETPLPRQCNLAIPLQEAIEHRATAFGIPVDARIEQGRNYRHALRQMIAHERFDRIVMAAAANGGPGFHADDVGWLLENAPGEIVVLRADGDESTDPPRARDPEHKRQRFRVVSDPIGAGPVHSGTNLARRISY